MSCDPSIAGFASDLLSGLVGSFIGVFAAFKIEEKRQNADRETRRQTAIQERDTREIGAGRIALFLLLQMFGTLENYWRQVVSKHAGSNEAWFRIGSTTQRWEGEYTLDLPSLGFLISDSLSADVLMHVALAERRFQECLAVVVMRSDTLERDARPRMETGGITDENASDATVRAAIGPHRAGKLVTLTAGAIKQLRSNLTDTPKTYNRLRSLLVKRFPGQYFPEIDFGEWTSKAGLGD